MHIVTDTRKQHRCNVCGCWSHWTKEHGYFQFCVNPHSMAGYEVQFIVCSEQCRSNIRKPIIEFLQKLPGYGKTKALKIFNNEVLPELNYLSKTNIFEKNESAGRLF